MDVYEAAQRLKDMVRQGDNDPRGRRIAMILVFGILYAEQLGRLNLKEVATLADILPSHETTIRYGMNIAEYVEVKPFRAS